MPDEVVYRYVGPGRFAGVPARDLTARDVARVPLSRRKALDAGTVYRKVEKAERKAATAPSPATADKE